MKLPKEERKYTYADYLTWSTGERWEIIEGVPILQAAPSWQHQAVSGQLLKQFLIYLEGKPCQAFAAPFDLRLPQNQEADEATTFVVQPDLVVICDRSGLKGTGYFGTPSLIIEISSPATARNDKVWKFNKYEQAGVREYWIVEPEGKVVSIFTLQAGRYGRPESYPEEGQVSVGLFPDLIIDLKTVFEQV